MYIIDSCIRLPLKCLINKKKIAFSGREKFGPDTNI